MNNSISWIKSRPLAHRGLFDNKEVAENSATSIKRAIDANFAIELDVNVSGDGKAIVFHDETLSRMTSSDGYVSNCTLDEIKSHPLLKSGDCVLSLPEALKLVGGKVPVLLDIMPSSRPNFEASILEGLTGYTGEIAICSSNPFTLEWFKLNAPSIKRGQRVSAFRKEKPTFAKKRLLKKMKYNNLSEPNFVVLKIEDYKKCGYKKIVKSGLPVVLYSVKNKKELNKAKDLSLNFVFEGEKLPLEEI